MNIAIVGDYRKDYSNHINTEQSLIHAAKLLNLCVYTKWIGSDVLRESHLKKFHAVWIAPGSPYRDAENVLTAIKFARESNIPLLATCGGFQHVIIEYAKNVLGYKNAQHAEYQPEGKMLFITPLACSVKGEKLQVLILNPSLAFDCYKREMIEEFHHCNYGLNPQYRTLLEQKKLRVAGIDSANEVRILEIQENEFFVATLFLPQSLSTVTNPHPLITRFIMSAENHSTKINKNAARRQK